MGSNVPVSKVMGESKLLPKDYFGVVDARTDADDDNTLNVASYERFSSDGSREDQY